MISVLVACAAAVHPLTYFDPGPVGYGWIRDTAPLSTSVPVAFQISVKQQNLEE